MYILGMSAFYHDSAACLIKDGVIIAAVQEERFSRKKHDPDFPILSINYCLAEAKISINELDCIAYYEKPMIKFERLLETYINNAPKGLSSFIKAMPVWLADKLWLPDYIRKTLQFKGELVFCEHHESHAASAFFPSPFSHAAVLTLDGVGEWATSSYGIGAGNKIDLISELKFPHSLGLLYSAFTYFTGFKVNSGEYKMMGLAPYGRPKYVNTILDNLLDLKDDGSFQLNMKYFDFPVGLRMTSKSFENLFSGPPRIPESQITQREMDIACSIQEVTEEVVLRMSRHVQKSTGQKKLCLAGGVALNCVANGKLLKAEIFDDIWIQPAAGDAGGALGAAYVAYYHHFRRPASEKNGCDMQKGSFLGPEYGDEEVKKFLVENEIPYIEMHKNDLVARTIELLINGKIVGWFQGRMEFGPRALGHRSILGDARDPEMQKKMNLNIKFRESFRPFAPSVLSEKVNEWFDFKEPSPYMLVVASIHKNKTIRLGPEENSYIGLDQLKVKRSQIPAVTHVDCSARIHTVDKETNSIFYDLVKQFDEKTGCPVLINTSFNVRGEPIVESPQDAYTCFMRTGMDALVINRFVLLKEKQPELKSDINWKKIYELD